MRIFPVTVKVSAATALVLLGFSCTVLAGDAPPTTSNTSTDNSPIPIIDISALVDSSSSRHERFEVAKQIGTACEDIGFFAVTNHGVSTSVITSAWRMTTEFFDLPHEEKMTVPSNDAEYPYGYEQSESLSVGKASQKRRREEIAEEHTSCDNHNVDETSATCGEQESDQVMAPPDLKETFAVGPSDPEKSGMPARRFPPRPEGMEQVYDAYYDAMLGLSSILLQAFALALDLEEDWFEDKMNRNMCALRVLNYPDLGDVVPQPGQLRAGAHSDYGVLLRTSGLYGFVLGKDDGVVRVL